MFGGNFSNNLDPEMDLENLIVVVSWTVFYYYLLDYIFCRARRFPPVASYWHARGRPDNFHVWSAYLCTRLNNIIIKVGTCTYSHRSGVRR